MAVDPSASRPLGQLVTMNNTTPVTFQDTAVQRLTANLRTATVRLTLLLTGVGISLGPVSALADSAKDLHAQLKERWYTTELVVFRYTNPTSSESLRFDGERVTAAEYSKRLLGAESAEPAEEAISVLTLGDTPENIAASQRPALDVEPGDTIKDYGNGEDLGALVAHNMATWENQLRSNDGEPLAAEQLTLIEQVKKLERSRRTELLLHTGWTQAVPDRDNGMPLTVAAGETYVDPRSGDSRSRLEGEVTVTLGRYLHVQPTLFYTPPYTPTDAAGGRTADNPGSTLGANSQPTRTAEPGSPEVKDLSSSSALDRLRDRVARNLDPASELIPQSTTDFEQELPPYARLEQSRRVRSGELHYIDHPELGVLVKVTPAAAPALLQEQFTLLQ